MFGLTEPWLRYLESGIGVWKLLELMEDSGLQARLQHTMLSHHPGSRSRRRGLTNLLTCHPSTLQISFSLHSLPPWMLYLWVVGHLLLGDHFDRMSFPPLPPPRQGFPRPQIPRPLIPFRTLRINLAQDPRSGHLVFH